MQTCDFSCKRGNRERARGEGREKARARVRGGGNECHDAWTVATSASHITTDCSRCNPPTRSAQRIYSSLCELN
jgi:hypothetical protein